MATFLPSRMQQRTGAANTLPTVPALGDPDTWNLTDIAISEFYFTLFNDTDWRLYTRSSQGIVKIATDVDITVLAQEAIVEATSRVQADEALQNAISVIQDLVDGYGQIITDHINNTSNPHNTTLDQVVAQNNKTDGAIDLTGYQINNVAAATENGDAVNFAQLQEYTTETNVYDLQGDIDLSSSPNFPEATKGMRWEVSVAGKPNGAPDSWLLEQWDEIICKADTAAGDYGTVGANWYFNKARILQATQEYSGTAEIATTAEAQTGSDDLRMMTPLKVAQKLSHWLTNTLQSLFDAKENTSNKTDTVAGNTASTTKYLSVKGVYDWVTSLGYITISALSSYATQAWVTSQGYITNVITALGYTPSNAAYSTIKTVSSDQATISGTFVNITDLFFAIGANETWHFVAKIYVTTSSTNGCSFTVTWPSGEGVCWFDTNNTGVNNRITKIINTSGTATSNVLSSVAFTEGYVEVTGTIANGATAGNVQIQVRTVTTTNTVTIKKHSTIYANRK